MMNIVTVIYCPVFHSPYSEYGVEVYADALTFEIEMLLGASNHY